MAPRPPGSRSVPFFQARGPGTVSVMQSPVTEALMRPKQQKEELLRLVRSMACSGKFKDLLEIEAALILQGRSEQLGQLRDPKIRRHFDEMCARASSRQSNI